MANKARHAFGNTENLQKALDENLIDSYDILFLDGDTEPKVGWVDKDGVVRIVENGADVDISGIESELATKANVEDVAQLETEVGKKADAEEVQATYEEIKYEIADVPVGTLINYREDEIRICCPENSAWEKQAVGEGGDANTYYCTFKTYAPDGAVGYIEHLNGQVDKEVLMDLKADKYGRKYQPTWLGLANYNEATDTWAYIGANSTNSKMIGWDYQIDWYNVDGVMIASDSVRINLSNETCHYTVEPYYIGKTKAEIEETVTKTVEEMVTKAVEDAAAIEVIEF